MAKDPAILFYVQDFLIGSSFLTPLQKGHYITLLCYQQQSENGSLPIEQIKALMRSDFAKHWPVLMLKFQTDTHGFFNARMRVEIERRKKFSKRQSDNAHKRWDDSGISDGNAMAMPLETETEIETVCIEKGGMGEIEINLKIPLADTVLESAERNQFTHTKKKNTEFIQSQWKVFLSERISEPEKKYHKISDLTSYFLNWIRTKFPSHGAEANKQSTTGSSTRNRRNNGAYQLLDDLKKDLAGGDAESV